MFDVPADHYGQFMGRFAQPLAVAFVERVQLRPGQRALDVGCGPGALTARLVQLLGADRVIAVDPSATFIAAVQGSLPGVDVRSGVAEHLPFPDDSFDVALAQLVVHFMSDPVAGLTEMRRVTRPSGTVGACVWDHAGGAGPLSTFWEAVHDLDPAAPGEAGLAGARQGHLQELCRAAGWTEIQDSTLTVSVTFDSFDDWWQPYTLAVGPAGAYVASLDEASREALRSRCAQLLPSEPFAVPASAWCVAGRA